MNKMIIFLLLAIFASIASAEWWDNDRWEKILSCDNGLAVVDRNIERPEIVQLVVHDRNVVNYLRNNLKAPYRVYSGNLVFHMGNEQPVNSIYDLRNPNWKTDGYRQLSSGEYIGGIYEVSMEFNGSDLRFIYKVKNLTTCRNGEMTGRYGSHCDGGTVYVGEKYLGDYIFRNCQ
ncbi:MAG: hypothetical protein A2504_00115 [Bdellovibrionales bacterium RIFOXYD12_FULL_39_22]|nr:MAG: hypothetical protein A2385_14910 [Bdellovibrionales bacterium RIFOXYB1_FULL_39_21]OFZ43731.1 MAG: hypothetical protein A2485_07735 [Bdellovibrionales bacterium RIFOXYC12_FULL_39_17]OFZ48098.1 MAG: hypothetical protein A2404_15755 [Bdellovibrionales bacterium RIFOXYC1_FULL_39_130]OFZ72149.1 MAG: hypothetical protein A2451_07790 [Bdellovibrionales bacterium RIFOXYC2_FULL_39_8]OFZ77239.1 MAG: hypothetical protein A2560_08230 [Bdellovibrionales bacterium RIFOXYD1_FULL_39_84]OFZ95701.1 MAG: